MTLVAYLQGRIKELKDEENGQQVGLRHGYSAILYAINDAHKKAKGDRRLTSIYVIFHLRNIVGRPQVEGLMTPEAVGMLSAYKEVLYKIRPKDRSRYEGA